MIGFLEGTIRSIGADELLLMVGGVGYRVHYVGAIPEVGEPAEFYIFDYIREDRRELFGFTDQAMHTLFAELIDISGVGPKLAQKILRVGTVAEITQQLTTGNIAFFTAISGVGKKTAQKIILELQGVLVQEEETRAGDKDVVEALMSLGYARGEVQDVCAQLSSTTTDARIHEALKLLSTL
jgi:Holliday junction DNA helicase RuvA